MTVAVEVQLVKLTLLPDDDVAVWEVVVGMTSCLNQNKNTRLIVLMRKTNTQMQK